MNGLSMKSIAARLRSERSQNLNIPHFIEQLTKDLAELDAIYGQLKRPRNLDAISLQKKRIETELTNLRELVNAENALSGSSTVAPKPTAAETRRYESEITNYAWDQSDKFVKLFIGLDGVQNATEENVIVTFTANSILLKVADVQGKDYRFAINNLLHEIDVAASYRKIKTNSIAIYAKKATESKLSETDLQCSPRKNHHSIFVLNFCRENMVPLDSYGETCG